MKKQALISLSRLVGLEIAFRLNNYGVAKDELDIILGNKKPEQREQYGFHGATEDGESESDWFDRPTDGADHLVKHQLHMAEITVDAPVGTFMLPVQLQLVADSMGAYLEQNGNLQDEAARDLFYRLCQEAKEGGIDLKITTEDTDGDS